MTFILKYATGKKKVLQLQSHGAEIINIKLFHTVVLYISHRTTFNCGNNCIIQPTTEFSPSPTP